MMKSDELYEATEYLRCLGKEPEFKRIFELLSSRERTSSAADLYSIQKTAFNNNLNLSRNEIQKFFEKLVKIGIGTRSNFRQISWNGFNSKNLAEVALGISDHLEIGGGGFIKSQRKKIKLGSISIGEEAKEHLEDKKVYKDLSSYSDMDLVTELESRGWKVNLSKA